MTIWSRAWPICSDGAVTAVRRLLAACLLAAAVAVVGASAASAASAPDACSRVTAAQAAADADAVFTGTVTGVERVDRSADDVLFANEVDVELVFKGRVGVETVTVATRPPTRRSAGLDALQRGESYLFFVRGVENDPAVFVAGGCSGTTLALDELVTRVEQLLGEGRGPVPPDPPAATLEPVEGSEPAAFTRAAAPGLALVLIGLLGLVVVRRLGRRA